MRRTPGKVPETQLYDSMDQLAASLESMRSGVNELKQGLNEAENARGIISGSKDEILDSNDQALASLNALSEQLGTIIPYIQTAKDASEVAHSSLTVLSIRSEICRNRSGSLIRVFAV